MRITGGQSRGRLLASLKGLDIRPSSDKVRETIFNLIGQDLSGLKVLDLYAGTGSMGIEALSRGALWVLFIDNSRQSVNLIARNLRRCGFELSGFIIRKDLTRGLPQDYSLLKERIDLVFIDPPYEKGLLPPILEKLSLGDLLVSRSLVVTESSKKDQVPSNPGRLHRIDTRNYGKTKIDIYINEDTR